MAIVTLGVGIGLNTALFSIINLLLFKPLSVERGDQLVWLSSASTKPNGPQGNLTYPDIVDLGELDTFAGTTAFGFFPANLATSREAVRLGAEAVTDNFFEVVGVAPLRGRTLTAAEPGGTAAPGAVISFAIWQRLFAGQDDAVGQAVRINGHHFTVVGVAPRGFRGVDVFERADVWIRVSIASQVSPDIGRPLERNMWWLKGVGRLAAGSTLEQARAAARTRAAAIAAAFPDSHDGFTVRVDAIRGMTPDDRGKVAPLSALLLGVTLTVLLIACANVANLLVARGVGQRREIAIRVALGASRWRLLRLRLFESLMLAAGGGLCALLLSMWFTDALLQLSGAPLEATATPDYRVLAFTATLSVVTALVFGLAPALMTAKAQPAPALKGDTSLGGQRPRTRLQSALVAGQLALSMVLLLAAAMFLKSLISARSADVGFDPRGRLALSFNLKMHSYSPERATAFTRALLDRVQSRPAVHSATLAELVPLGGRVTIGGLSFPGRPDDPDARPPMAAFNHVWPRFFETMGIPILRGRALSEQDLTGARGTAVVNQVFAERQWPGLNPIGQRFSLDGPRGPFLEVVGVAANTAIDELVGDPMAMAYLPGRASDNDTAVLAWVDGDPASALRMLENEVRALDASIAVFEPKTLEAHIAERMDNERGLSRILAVAGGLALGLAALGLYGVVSYTVSRRTREIGVRVALGARRAEVVRLFVSDALRLAVTGLACGLPPALAVSALLASQLVGGQIGDPAALAAVTLVLTLVVLIAAYIPARRAVRVDPIVALRVE